LVLNGCGERLSVSRDVAALSPSQRVPVHRLFVPYTGEHFYTNSKDEALWAEASLGFSVEALDYFYLANTQLPGTVPFYRCYLANINRHLYTTSSNCEGTGYAPEGGAPMGFIATAPMADTTPLRRLYNEALADHIYTPRQFEHDVLPLFGYGTDEGLSGHVWVPPLYIAVNAVKDGSELDQMKSALAPNGSGPNVVLGWSDATWYLSVEASGPAQDFTFDPSSLNTMFQLAKDKNLPLVVHLNGGRWMNSAPLPDLLSASVPLFRLHNSGDHLLTKDRAERDSFGGSYQGVIGGILEHALADGTSFPLYRLSLTLPSSPPDRIYTIYAQERDDLIAQGWSYEGVHGHVFPWNQAGYKGMPTIPLYRLRNPSTGRHLFTTNEAERSLLVSQGWVAEGVPCQLPADPWVTLEQDELSLFTPYDPSTPQTRAATAGKQFLSLSRLNKIHYDYKKRSNRSPDARKLTLSAAGSS
jgi:hypothetical protein